MIIKIDTSNDAFQNGNYNAEVSRLLKDLADRIALGTIPMSLPDANGNPALTVDL